MASNSNPQWGSSYRLIASEKWKAKSAVMGRDLTAALVEYSRPKPGMKILDLASGTGEPAISLAARVGSGGHVTALDLSSDLLQIATRDGRGSLGTGTGSGSAFSPFAATDSGGQTG
jgi:2-polyprenyl-3-methyl-5-hydroxy-6-metoxy-1,4-benzoquinol methylase